VFEYDASADLDPQYAPSEEFPGYTVRDLSYASPLGGRVPAFLVVPRGEGPFPALLYMHHGFGNRRTFRPEAEVLAGAGVVSLLLDSPFVRPEFRRSDRTGQPVEAVAAAEAALYRQLVVDCRRGVDLLASLPEVDAERIGYVGHSLGATWGGPLAGVERRLRALVLMAGYPSIADAYRSNPHPVIAALRSRLGPEDLETYLAVLAPLAGEPQVARAAPAALFFQFALRDEFITRQEAERYYAAASQPKDVAWYDTDHLFTGTAAPRLDRVTWLAARLGFAPLSQATLRQLQTLADSSG